MPTELKEFHTRQIYKMTEQKDLEGKTVEVPMKIVEGSERVRRAPSMDSRYNSGTGKYEEHGYRRLSE